MEETIKTALEERKITPATLTSYLRNIKYLNDGKPIKNFNFLNDEEKVEKKLEKYNPKTRRNFYIAISAILKSLDNPKLKKLYDKWYNILKASNTKIKSDDALNIKSEKQEKNWIPQEDILKKRDELRDKVNVFKNHKVIDSHEYNTLLNYMILSLYTYLPPRRSKDFATMLIAKPKEVLNPNKNYLLKRKNKYYFKFGEFKTKKAIGNQEVELPLELENIVKLYLKHKPLNEYFIVSYENHPLNVSNGMTLRMNRIFGKHFSVSMLRHVYLSEKYGKVHEEQKADALALGHSVGTLQEYIKN